MGQVGQIVNLTVLPYGNAHETQNPDGSWSFTCQHGKDECAANLLETCAIYTYTNQNEWFPYFVCIEGDDDPARAGQRCAQQTSLDWSKINNCVTSSIGNQAQHQVAVATDALDHEYTPWVVLNGKHIPDEQTPGLLTLVCNAYTGPKPSGCS